MFDAKSLLDQFLGQANPGGSARGISPDMLKGAALGGLAGLLLGGKFTRTALKIGGTAALASLAYRAYRNWQAAKTGAAAGPMPQAPMKDVTPQPEGTAFLPSTEKERGALSLALLRAMIAAAKADGHIDAAEQQRIFGKLEALNLDAEARAWVMDELKKPLDIDTVVAASTSPEVAAEIYAASLLAIDPDDPAEWAYLAMLAARLKLDPGLKTAIEMESAKAVA